MNIFLPDHQRFLKSLIKNDVNFLLIGGYAVVLHGYRRTTGDIDLWINPSNENKIKLLEALKGENIEEEDLSELGKQDFEDYLVFSLGEEPEKIDFMTQINGVSFNDAYINRLEKFIDDMLIPYINLSDLVLSKMGTGRKKDEADIEELQKIESLKRK